MAPGAPAGAARSGRRRPVLGHLSRGGSRGDVRHRAQSLPRGALDARHLVGHRLRRDAARLRRRLPSGDRHRLPRRVQQRHRGGVAGADEPAGGRRARRQAHQVDARRRRGGRRAAARALRQPRVRAAAADRVRRQGRHAADPRREHGLRRDAQRTRRAGHGPLHQRSGSRRAPPRRVHRPRSPPEVIRQPQRRRRNRAHRGTAVRSDRRDGRQGPDVRVFRAGSLLRVHSLHVDERARGHAVSRHAGDPDRQSAAAAEGDSAGARRAGAPDRLQSERRSRAEHQRLGREFAGDRGHHQRPEGRARRSSAC